MMDPSSNGNKLTVTIPSTSQRELERKVTFYNVVVEFFPQNGAVEMWQLMVRYSDVLELFTSLNASKPFQPPFSFPRKSFMQSNTIIEDRRVRFQKLLQAAVEIHPLPIEIFLFLEIKRHLEMRYPSFVTTSPPSDVLAARAMTAPVPIIQQASPNSKATAPTGGIVVDTADDDLNSTPLRQSYVEKWSNGPSRLREVVMSQKFKNYAKISLLFRACFFLTIIGSLLIASYQLYGVVRVATLESLWNDAVAMLLYLQYHCTFTGEILLICIIVATCSHRLFGYILTAYLSSLLKTPSGGFNFKFGWLSVRLGLDINAIIIHDIYWLNPPQFENTPYFLRVGSILLRFKPVALWNCFVGGEDLSIVAVEINRVTCHIEKEKKSGLNLWSALGATSEGQEKQVRQDTIRSVMNAIAAAPMATVNMASSVAKYNPVSVVLNAVMGSDAAEKGQSDGVANGPGPGPEDLCDGDECVALSPTSPASPAVLSASVKRSSSKSKKSAKSKKEPVEKGQCKPAEVPVKGFGIPIKFSVKRLTVRKLHVYAQDFLNADHSSSSKSNAIKVGILDMLHRELRNNDLPVRKENDEDMLHDHTSAHVEPTNKHSAVYRRKDLHRQSMLKSTSIFSSFTASSKSVKTVGGNDEDDCDDDIIVEDENEHVACTDGLYLDDLVWVIVGRLITDLICSNSSQILAVVAAAAANNTIAGTMSAVKTAGSTAVHGANNYNPFQMVMKSSNAMNHMIASTSMNDNGAVQCQKYLDLGVTAISIRVFCAKKLIFGGKRITGCCFCSLSLENQPEGVDGSGDCGKTNIHSNDEDGVWSWNEDFEFGILYTLETVVRLRIYQYKMGRRDCKICERRISIGELLDSCDLVKKESIDWYNLGAPTVDGKPLTAKDGTELECNGDIQLGWMLK